MNVLGIVAEFDPFHDGHKYLIDTASALTKADVCISVMSGNFVQRGKPAVFNKWERACDAVKGGIDLVLELPEVYSLSGAEDFSYGAISILDASGITHLSFGSESGDLDKLLSIKNLKTDLKKNNSEKIKEYLSTGLSYPAALDEALKKVYPDIDFSPIKSPNDILGIEYLHAIDEINPMIKPVAIRRQGKGHIESSTEIRDLIKREKEDRFNEMDINYFNLARYKVLSMTGSEIDEYDTASEGLGNRIKDEIRNASSLDDLINRVKSKRYTYGRLSRLIARMILDIMPEDIKAKPVYIRPLSMNDKGAAYLKSIKNDIDNTYVDSVSQSIKYSDEIIARSLEIDVLAGDIYSLIYGEDMYPNSDYVRHQLVLR